MRSVHYFCYWNDVICGVLGYGVIIQPQGKAISEQCCSVVLCFVVFCCVLLCCLVLCCLVLCILCCAALCCLMLGCVVLCCAVLCSVLLCCAVHKSDPSLLVSEFNSVEDIPCFSNLW